GYHTALQLARAGAQVVLAVRDTERGETARAEVGAAAVVRLDLAEQASVREAAAEILARWPRIDVLVNNAGVMAPPRLTTADGFELQMATNHFGPFALTGLLIDALREARVVTVSSGMHRNGKIAFDDLQSERGYHRWHAYSQSKLANLLFTFELGRRAASAGLSLTSVAAHPGIARTNLQASGPGMDGNRVRQAIIVGGTHLIGQSDAKGALPSLYAATVPDLPSGTYVGPSGLFEGRGHPKLVSASKGAHDEATARRLWEVSEELTGVSYL
ncbi:MAG TPA: oxidoreductase, partial [Solirubrobacteraceae bacterium]|nr:oxidoreductase [Solirubrobacteraceae bacterium]